MKKDIFIPEPKGVKLAIVPMEGDSWDLYFINENHHSIRNILVVTNAYSHDQITSTIRYYLESMNEVSFIKFETIIGEVIELENVISITYYVGLDFYDKEFRFTKSSLQQITPIPLLNLEGVVME
jgi:hypothetical protein